MTPTVKSPNVFVYETLDVVKHVSLESGRLEVLTLTKYAKASAGSKR